MPTARLLLASLLPSALPWLGPSAAEACSWVLFSREDYPVLSARTLDWAHSFDDYLLVNPRGQAMDGGAGACCSKTWTSKYGSVAASVNGWLSRQVSNFTGESFDWYQDGASEAINEAGLAAHILYLEATQYAPLDHKAASVTYMRWVRYLVDNFATVSEAVAGMGDVEVAGVKIINDAFPEGAAMGIHLAMEDRSGDAAIIEIDHGKMLIYHGRSQNYSVMTNDPALPKQLENLKRYKPFGGELALPGDTTAMDRFVRMTYFLSYVPEAHDSTVMAGYLRSIIMASAVPQGAPDEESTGYAVSPTWWVSIMDFQEMLYYWSWTLNPNVIWVDVNRLKREGWFNEGRPYAFLNPRQGKLAGDVSGAFVEADPGLGELPVNLPGSAWAPLATSQVALVSLFLLGGCAALSWKALPHRGLSGQGLRRTLAVQTESLLLG